MCHSVLAVSPSKGTCSLKSTAMTQLQGLSATCNAGIDAGYSMLQLMLAGRAQWNDFAGRILLLVPDQHAFVH